jgi:hypothetical protein
MKRRVAMNQTEVGLPDVASAKAGLPRRSFSEGGPASP